jgi:hypothetical protein
MAGISHIGHNRFLPHHYEIVITENKNTSGSYILLATGCGSNLNSIEIKLSLLPA